MVILHKIYAFNLPHFELVQIYVIFIRAVVEQSAVVWHAALTEEEHNTIERVQKVALKIIFNQDYIDYENELKLSNLKTLMERRDFLCLKFAKRCVSKETGADMFPVNTKTVNTRPHEKYFVQPANTERLRKSAIPYMQRLLNLNYN